jgi:hypothetical protein
LQQYQYLAMLAKLRATKLQIHSVACLLMVDGAMQSVATLAAQQAKDAADLARASAQASAARSAKEAADRAALEAKERAAKEVAEAHALVSSSPQSVRLL